MGTRWRSGVRALNTGTAGSRDSGVFGRDIDEGPDVMRFREDSGVLGLKVGIGGG